MKEYQDEGDAAFERIISWQMMEESVQERHAIEIEARAKAAAKTEANRVKEE